MTREQLRAYIADVYGTVPEMPWAMYPENEVFRHSNNKKWFALIMPVAREKLGLCGPGNIDVVNLKSAPVMIGSMLAEPGFFPAYHMNKTSWLSAALDGSVGDETIKMLLEISYDLTAVKKKAPSRGEKKEKQQ